MKAGIERRVAAPHPGPIIRRDFLDVVGMDAATLAAQIGTDAEILAEMLDGRRSIDVPTSVRLARALQLPAERIMQMQVRCDFALARHDEELQSVDVLRSPHPGPFPETGFLRGRLGRAGDDRSGDGSLFFQEDVSRQSGDDYAGFHALWPGDRLRVYAPGDKALWIGPILHNLDGQVLLPFVRAHEWPTWFAAGYRADLAVGAEHAAFFDRMRDA